MNLSNTSLSLSNPNPQINGIQKLALGLASIGVVILLVTIFGINFTNPGIFLGISTLLMVVGGGLFTWQSYSNKPAGIKNNDVMFNSLTNRGVWAWIVGIILTAFYCLLYWWPQYLGYGGDGGTNTGLAAMFDPLSQFFKNQNASEWFIYGTLYTIAILIMGFKFIYKYRHNKYQILRTISVMFFQLGFAFLLPEILMRLNYPYYDFKNMWPLNIYFFDHSSLNGMLSAGNIGLLMLGSGFLMMFLISPFLTYKYGKRWYCSWVCGCGGLAETAGDPFRQLSDKSLIAWKIERWMIHAILAIVTIVSLGVIYTYVRNTENILVTPKILMGIVVGLVGIVFLITFMNRKSMESLDRKILYSVYGILALIGIFAVVSFMKGSSEMFFINSQQLRKWYGFFIASAFSGVIGVGFYPIMGSRVWCRFGCPMAAILGLQQKYFSKFRITTNGGQCISCGNCSTYCEMGIDVRSYAQKGQDIVRASCVGCGICSAVCPRGVLRLENGSKDISQRAQENRTIHITEDEISILS